MEIEELKSWENIDSMGLVCEVQAWNGVLMGQNGHA